MTTITTYNGITLGFVEIPKDTYDFKIVKSVYNLDLTYKELSHKNIFGYQGTSQVIKNTTENSIVEIIGTTSTLTNEQVEPFIEDCLSFAKCWKNYNTGRSCYSALESFNSLLEGNNIDLTKEYVVLQIKND